MASKWLQANRTAKDEHHLQCFHMASTKLWANQGRPQRRQLRGKVRAAELRVALAVPQSRLKVVVKTILWEILLKKKSINLSSRRNRSWESY